MSVATEKTDKPKRKYRVKPQPLCPEHGVPMLVRSTQGELRYCYCPVPACKESTVQSRE